VNSWLKCWHLNLVLTCAALGRAPRQTSQDNAVVTSVAALEEAEQVEGAMDLILDVVIMRVAGATTPTIHNAKFVASMATPLTSDGIGMMKTMS
jgi:hypothetical protein